MTRRYVSYSPETARTVPDGRHIISDTNKCRITPRAALEITEVQDTVESSCALDDSQNDDG